MLRFLLHYSRYSFLVVLILGWVALPGPEGWSGAVIDGDRLASEHRLLSALDSYETAAEFPGGLPTTVLRRAGVYLRRGQWKEASDLYGLSGVGGTGSREALLGLAEAQEKLGEWQSSLTTLRKALELRPGDEETWGRLVELAARQGLRPGEIAGLLEGLPSPGQGMSAGPWAAYLMGACIVGADSVEGAAWLRRAAAGSDQRARDGAEQLLDALSSQDEGRDRRDSLARALLAQEMVGPALASLDGLSEKSPDDAEGWALRAFALMRIGQRDAAEDAVRRSLALRPEQSLGEFVLGSLLRARGDAEGAVSLLVSADKLEPGNPAVYAELANAASDLGDYSTTEQALAKAVESDPQNAELRLAVASFYVDSQYRVEEALGDAEAAVQLSGRSVRSLSTLGWALHLTGRSQDALGLLQEAVAKDPESPLLRYRLGSVLEALGQKEQSREQYLLVEQLDGPGDQWKRAQVALKGLAADSTAESLPSPSPILSAIWRGNQLWEGLWHALTGAP